MQILAYNNHHYLCQIFCPNNRGHLGQILAHYKHGYLSQFSAKNGGYLSHIVARGCFMQILAQITGVIWAKFWPQ